MQFVAAPSRGRESRPSAKTAHRRTPTESGSVLRTDPLSVGVVHESSFALLSW